MAFHKKKADIKAHEIRRHDQISRGACCRPQIRAGVDFSYRRQYEGGGIRAEPAQAPRKQRLHALDICRQLRRYGGHLLRDDRKQAKQYRHEWPQT
ncbi:hypothetical protein FQ775_14865 [Nitratireductor mangrovi]|uniref:Uncharacterized protein n=1 Tax=Nitratireductor mangrovi TaxID=2599600 RepID=A0A5B8L0M6_9HYPH|nr:hypothetical protein [Nitratireductor mangrovi]QDZ01554.1 hypothetical protein FQ775_14865 [Nitratireductor mangrovi]